MCAKLCTLDSNLLHLSQQLVTPANVVHLVRSLLQMPSHVNSAIPAWMSHHSIHISTVGPQQSDVMMSHYIQQPQTAILTAHTHPEPCGAQAARCHW